jgi:predicted PilT family ATPase
VKLIVSNEYAGAILGLSGANKKQVEQQTGTHIQIEKIPWESRGGQFIHDTKRLVTIVGDDKNTREAVDVILDKISRDSRDNYKARIRTHIYSNPLFFILGCDLRKHI